MNTTQGGTSSEALHPRRRPRLVLVLALAVSSSAGWVDADIIENVQNLETRVAKVKGDPQKALGHLQEMIPSFRNGIDTVKDDLETLVDLTLAQTRMLAKSELEGLQTWIGGGIDVDAAGSPGGVFTTIGTAGKWVWEMATRNVKQLELVAFQNQILANQATIMDNQKRILRALWGTR